MFHVPKKVWFGASNTLNFGSCLIVSLRFLEVWDLTHKYIEHIQRMTQHPHTKTLPPTAIPMIAPGGNGDDMMGVYSKRCR